MKGEWDAHTKLASLAPRAGKRTAAKRLAEIHQGGPAWWLHAAVPQQRRLADGLRGQNDQDALTPLLGYLPYEEEAFWLHASGTASAASGIVTFSGTYGIGGASA